MIIPVKLYAYIPEFTLSHIKPSDFKDGEIAKHLMFTDYDPKSHGGTVVGTVNVEVELLPTDKIIVNAADALRAKAIEIRAKATKECAELEGRAQQLLAIENRSMK
jgi:hypothetical protein